MSSSEDLSKLTVPQLKALCKERKITGYSKLGKVALLDKLKENNAAAARDKAPIPAVIATGPNILAQVSEETRPDRLPDDSGPTDTRSQQARSSTIKDSRTSETCTRTDLLEVTQDTALASTVYTGTSLGNASTSRINTSRTDHAPAALAISSSSTATPLEARMMPPPSTIPAPRNGQRRPDAPKTPAKRPSSTTSVTPAKKAKIHENAAPVVSTDLLSTPNKRSFVLPLVQVEREESMDATRQASMPSVKQNAGAGDPNMATNISVTPSRTRFKPLVVKGLSSTAAVAGQPRFSTHIDAPNDGHVHLRYLELPPTAPIPFLKSISLPPSLSQRKRVQTWAIILRDINESDCKNCTFVSKMFRYAVYLSAQERLKRHFNGRRLRLIEEQYSIAVTNLWPYLRYRQKELHDRILIFESSFLASGLRKCLETSPRNIISDQLWGSVDSEEQLTIALRFLLTTFWFAMSIGGQKSDAWLDIQIVDAQEVVMGEVWALTILSRSPPGSRRISRMYVLQATCEVIGQASPDLNRASTTEPQKSLLDMPLRADWSCYVRSHLRDPASSASLLAQLKWANFEEYDRGISRLWLKRISTEGDEGLAKRVVADRYVLACVVANSLSGQWMTTTAMAQESAGIADKYGLPTHQGRSAEKVNLYLQAHHHVESVHFKTSSGVPLHPAIAVVQTLCREYYVLKDNGMEIGSEEEGVAPIWMEIIGCDSRGFQT